MLRRHSLQTLATLVLQRFSCSHRSIRQMELQSLHRKTPLPTRRLLRQSQPKLLPLLSANLRHWLTEGSRGQIRHALLQQLVRRFLLVLANLREDGRKFLSGLQRPRSLPPQFWSSWTPCPRRDTMAYPWLKVTLLSVSTYSLPLRVQDSWMQAIKLEPFVASASSGTLSNSCGIELLLWDDMGAGLAVRARQ